MNFNFMELNIDENEREQRIMRLKVRVKGIISEIAAAADSTRVP